MSTHYNIIYPDIVGYNSFQTWRLRHDKYGLLEVTGASISDSIHKRRVE